jgi:hypothetical protein
MVPSGSMRTPSCWPSRCPPEAVRSLRLSATPRQLRQHRPPRCTREWECRVHRRRARFRDGARCRYVSRSHSRHPRTRAWQIRASRRVRARRPEITGCEDRCDSLQRAHEIEPYRSALGHSKLGDLAVAVTFDTYSEVTRAALCEVPSGRKGVGIPSTSIYYRTRELRQAPGRGAELPLETRTCGNEGVAYG